MSRLWRTATISAASCAVVASGAGLAIAQPTSGPTVSITVKSQLPEPRVSGDTFVVFKGGAAGRVTVSGTVTGDTAGQVAQLFARPFPYSKAAAPVAGQQVALDGSSPQTYSFAATPGIATRYSVEVLPGGTVSTPVAGESAARTVFVVTSQKVTNVASCNRPGNRPVCHETIHIFTKAPASALAKESKKKLYFYFALKLSKNASEPKGELKWLFLQHHVTIGKPKRVSSTDFEQTVKFSFRVNEVGYAFNFNFCTKGSESADGVNLPGHHHCGARKVWWTWFLG